MSEIVRKSILQDGRMYNIAEQDESTVIDQNTSIKQALAHSRQKYGKGLHMARVARMTEVGVEAMANGTCCKEARNNKKRYRILSPDPDERRRAILHLQSCHPEYMVVDGTPFGKTRTKWQ